MVTTEEFDKMARKYAEIVTRQDELIVELRTALAIRNKQIALYKEILAAYEDSAEGTKP